MPAILFCVAAETPARPRSGTVRYGRLAMIFFAVDAPMPGSASSCFSLAVLRSTGPDDAGGRHGGRLVLGRLLGRVREGRGGAGKESEGQQRDERARGETAGAHGESPSVGWVCVATMTPDPPPGRKEQIRGSTRAGALSTPPGAGTMRRRTSLPPEDLA